MEQVKSLLGQLLSAVSFLHENGVIHRDIKPENVLVDRTRDEKPVLKVIIAAGRSESRDDKNSVFFL